MWEELVKLYYLIKQLMGGGTTMQNLADEFSVELDLAYYSSSGAFLMDGSEDVLYDHNAANDPAGNAPFKFNGGYIDLSAMVAGDVIVIKIYATSADATNLRQLSIDAANTYTGVQSQPPQITIAGLPEWPYEIKVTATQTAHPVSYKTIQAGFTDAVRGT